MIWTAHMLTRLAPPSRMRFSVDHGGLRLGHTRLCTEPIELLLDEIELLVGRPGRHLVMTLNVDQTLEIEANPGLRAVFERASLRVLDGMPIVLLARLLGVRKAQRNTGADLLPRVAAIARERGWRIAIVGGRPEVADEAVAHLEATTRADIVAIDMPQLLSVDDPSSMAVVDDLRAVGPQIVFLCLGSPKQELWFASWSAHLPDGVYVGAGAAVDFAAAARRRAPRLLQQLGGEWLWRLAQEPRRLWHRYLLRGPRFLFLIARSLAPSMGRRIS